MTLLKLSNSLLNELIEINEFSCAAAFASVGNDVGQEYRSEYLDFFFAQLDSLDEFSSFTTTFISELDSESDDVYFRFGYVTQFIKSVDFELATRKSLDFDYSDGQLLTNSEIAVKHGGKRSGSGRKKESPTRQVRVDFELADIFKTLSDVYRVSDQDQKLSLVKRLLTLSSLDCDIISK